MNRKTMIKKLKQIGYNRDTEIPEEAWNSIIEEMDKTDLSLAFVEHKSEPSYRDSEVSDSLHLKDCRDLENDKSFIAELEHYNPRRAPLRHLIVDFPLWLWRSRLKPLFEISRRKFSDLSIE